MLRLGSILFLLFAATIVKAEEAKFYLLQYSHGPNWNAEMGHDEQPGIDAHRAFLKNLYDRSILLLGGPLTNREGGMMLVRETSQAAAEKLAGKDPAVKSQLLNVDVLGWNVTMSSMRSYRQREIKVDPNAPFTLERKDMGAPIALPD